MNEKVSFIVILILTIFSVFTGCSSQPTAAGSDRDIEKLGQAYSELEQRYNRLAEDHRQLIEGQRAIGDAQQITTDRIGFSIVELDERTGSISESVRGISSDIADAIRLIQQYIDGQQKQGQNNSGFE